MKSMHAIAEHLRQQNDGHDTVLAHIHPLEAEMLDEMFGSSGINPETGLPQFGFGLKKIKKGVKKIGKGIKKGAKAIGDGAGWIADKTKNIPGVNAFTSQLALLDDPSKFVDIWKNNIAPQWATGAMLMGGNYLMGGQAGIPGIGGNIPTGGTGGAGGTGGGGFWGNLGQMAGNIFGGGSGSGGNGSGGGGGLFGGSSNPMGSALGSILGGTLGYLTSDDLESKTKTTMPKWQEEGIRHGLNANRTLYDSGLLGQVAGLDPITLQGIAGIASADATAPYKTLQSSLMQQIGGMTNPDGSLAGPAGKYLGDVLGGKYLEEGNPYLQGVINAAQGDVQSAIGSQYANGGRTASGAEARAMAEQLGDLSNKFRYQNYGDERNRMNQAAGLYNDAQNTNLNLYSQAANLQNSILNTYGQQVKAGGVLRDYNQQMLDAPYAALQQYLAPLGRQGTYGGTNTAIQEQNPWLNALGGAGIGASVLGGRGSSGGQQGTGTSTDGWAPDWGSGGSYAMQTPNFDFGAGTYGFTDSGNPWSIGGGQVDINGGNSTPWFSSLLRM